jgi:UDPglucose 6-dehydrogenase
MYAMEKRLRFGGLRNANITQRLKMKNPKIGFVGMTHLGLVSGVSAAEKGFEVVCFDQSPTLIQEIAAGKLPISEPELDRLFSFNRERLEITAQPEDLSKCDLIYVAPDIATDDFGVSDLSAIDELLDLTFSFSRTDAVLVVLSQVPPGYVRKKQIKGRLLFYQVETLIFGQAVERALFPERFIVGCRSPNDPLPSSYMKFLEAHNCKILTMRYESAELAKISINMFLVSSVTTANSLAELCEEIGADWNEIIPALRMDKRIGQYAYVQAGLGISGGNLERDLTTFKKYALNYDISNGIVDSWIKNSDHRKDWIWSIFKKLQLTDELGLNIALLGLAYKENTHSIKNSPALVFLNRLKNSKVLVYDPEAVISYLPLNVSRVNSISNALNDADVLIISTPWREFKEIGIDEIAVKMRGKIIIDPYGICNENQLTAKGFKLFTLGK